MHMTISMSQRRINKRYIIPKGRSKMDNQRNRQLRAHNAKKNHNTTRVGHHHTQANTNNVNKT